MLSVYFGVRLDPRYRVRFRPPEPCGGPGFPVPVRSSPSSLSNGNGNRATVDRSGWSGPVTGMVGQIPIPYRSSRGVEPLRFHLGADGPNPQPGRLGSPFRCL